MILTADCQNYPGFAWHCFALTQAPCFQIIWGLLKSGQDCGKQEVDRSGSTFLWTLHHRDKCSTSLRTLLASCSAEGISFLALRGVRVSTCKIESKNCEDGWTRNSDTNHEQEATLHSSGIYLYISRMRNHWKISAVVEIRLARQSWSTWGRLAYGSIIVCSKAMSNICLVTNSLYVRFVSECLHVSHLGKTNKRKGHEKPIDGTITTCHRGHLWHSDASF